MLSPGGQETARDKERISLQAVSITVVAKQRMTLDGNREPPWNARAKICQNLH